MPYTTTQIRQMIRAEAQRQGVDPQLALAVATQESALNPHAVGDNGQSLGLFQLQRAAAIDAGIDPERRAAVPENIRGGVTYLKQKLAQSKGNIEQALSRYNRGTPTYRGIGDPHYVDNVMQHYGKAPARPSMLARVGKAISPRRADAAPPRAAPGVRDWQVELFGTAPGAAAGARRAASSVPGAESGPAPAAARDWQAALFGTTPDAPASPALAVPAAAPGAPPPAPAVLPPVAPAAVPPAPGPLTASPAPAPTRDWGAELFGTPRQTMGRVPPRAVTPPGHQQAPPAQHLTGDGRTPSPLGRRAS